MNCRFIGLGIESGGFDLTCLPWLFGGISIIVGVRLKFTFFKFELDSVSRCPVGMPASLVLRSRSSISGPVFKKGGGWVLFMCFWVRSVFEG